MIRTGSNRILVNLLPLFVDAITFLAVALYLPLLAAPLKEPSGLNALLLVILYLSYCLGVFFIRKLQPLPASGRWQPPPVLVSPKTRAVLAFFFGLLMMTTAAYQIGYFQSIQSVASATLDEGDSSALFVYMPGALLGFSMLYILVLAFPVQANVAARSRAFLTLSLLGLIFSNTMLIFSSAQAVAIISLVAAPQTPAVFLIASLVLLLSFGPPRLLFQTKVPSAYASFTLLLLILFMAWRIVAAA